MPITVTGVVGAAQASHVSSLAIPLTAAVPPTTPSLVSVIFVCTQISGMTPSTSTTDAGPVSDNAQTSSIPYGNTPDIYCTAFGPANEFSGVQGEMRMVQGFIYRQLHIGDIITVGPFTNGGVTATANFARAVLVAMTGTTASIDPGNPTCVASCSPSVAAAHFFDAVGGQSNSGATVSDSNAISGTPGLALQMLCNFGVPLTSSLTFTDGATVLDSWYDQGGSEHDSGVIGYLLNPTGTVDFGGTSDQSAAGAAGISECWGTLQNGSGGGPGCPAVGPVFDNFFRLA